MKNYKVSFWFGDSKGAADKVVHVQTDKTERRDITLLALKELRTYPRTYQVLVEPAEDVETLYVVQITNSDKANSDAWYHERDGELFVVRKVELTGMYRTCHFLGNTSTVGTINPKFCTIVNTFKAENIF